MSKAYKVTYHKDTHPTIQEIIYIEAVDEYLKLPSIGSSKRPYYPHVKIEQGPVKYCFTEAQVSGFLTKKINERIVGLEDVLENNKVLLNHYANKENIKL